MNHNFVHLEYPLTHPGVDRAEKVVNNFKRLSDTFNPTRTLAIMLMAAVLATLHQKQACHCLSRELFAVADVS